MELILIFVCFPFFIALIDFGGFLFKGKRVIHIIFATLAEIGAFIILPYLYLAVEGSSNDCCSDSAAFSPEHRLTMIVIIILCVAAYFYSRFRTKIATPVVEILVNCLVVTGIILNIFIAIHTGSSFLAFFGNGPIILFSILVLVQNQKMLIQYSENPETGSRGRLEKFFLKVLTMKPLLKYPVIFILCLPLLTIVTALLLLVGQKPDAIIRAFTETYKHGFSQWDYKCDNVQCGGHYLCSVAANGHKKIVRPQRLGKRNGNDIICNRQLLISNAFEELVQERFPFMHKAIRKHYNKVGNFIHRYYSVFNNKYVSDFIYVLMKPAEWIFLLTLYTFDRKPENRIASQYLPVKDREEIDKCII